MKRLKYHLGAEFVFSKTISFNMIIIVFHGLELQVTADKIRF